MLLVGEKEKRLMPQMLRYQAFQRMVPVVGLEPTRSRPRRILNPLRLPFHHTGGNKSYNRGRCVDLQDKFFRQKAQKNGRFIAESSALVGRVCQPKNEIPCSRSGKFRKCVGRIQFQTSNKFCPLKRMIGRVSSEMFIKSSTEETKCRSLCMEGSGRGEEEISPRRQPVRHH